MPDQIQLPTAAEQANVVGAATAALLEFATAPQVAKAARALRAGRMRGYRAAAQNAAAEILESKLGTLPDA